MYVHFLCTYLRCQLILSQSQGKQIERFWMSSSSCMGRHLWVANYLPMMEGRVFTLLVHFHLNQRNLLLHLLIRRRKRKKSMSQSYLGSILCNWRNMFVKSSWFFSTLQGWERVQDHNSNCWENRHVPPYSVPAWKAEGYAPRNHTSTWCCPQGVAFLEVKHPTLLSLPSTFLWILYQRSNSLLVFVIFNAVMSQCPDPFSLPLLVIEEILVRVLSVGEVTTRACGLHKWGFHWI